MKQDNPFLPVGFTYDRGRLLSIGLPLLSWGAIVSLVTFFPYNFQLDTTNHTILDLKAAAFLDWIDITLNILLFLPFGVLLSALFEPASTRWQDIGKFVVPVGLLISLTIEILQQFLPPRDPSFVDVLSNTFGIFLGAVAGLAFQRSAIGRAALRFRKQASRLGRFAFVGALSAGLVAISAGLQYAARPVNWNPDFFLTIGNEHTKDRPWRGRVLAVDISDTSPSAEALQNFARGGQLNQRGNVASLRFTNNGVSESTGEIPPLSRVGSPNPLSSHGAQLTEHSWLQTTEKPASIANRIRASNAFALRLVCASDNPRQSGPARILSYAADPMQANFVVGQENSNLVFRLRTPSTGLNGIRTPLAVPNLFQEKAVRDILITYSQSILNLVVAGSKTVHSLEFGPGSTLALLYLSPHANHFPYYKIGYYAVVFLIGLGTVAFVTVGSRQYLLVCALWLPVFACLLEIGLMVAGAKDFNSGSFCLSMLIGCISVIPFFPVGEDGMRRNTMEARLGEPI